MLRNYLFNGYRRLSAEALYFLIPFGTGAFVGSLLSIFGLINPPLTWGSPIQVTPSIRGQTVTTTGRTAKQDILL